MILSVTVVFLIVNIFRSITIKLVLLIGLGYILQLGFGFIRGGGFEALRLKYVSSGTSAIALQACTHHDPRQVIARYNELFGESSWEGTKPPGLMSFYIITNKIVDFVKPASSTEECFQNLTDFAAYIFPFVSLLVLLPLYGISRVFFGEEDAILPCLLYIFVPNLHIFPLYQDQFLFPLIFTLLMFLIIRAGNLHSLPLAFVSGVGIYAATFLSFSLLPIIGFALLWVAINVGLQNRWSNLGDAFKLWLGIFSGFAFLAFLFYQFLDYDHFLRYEEALMLHRTLKQFQPGGKQIFQAILLNNIEFAALVGFPLFILFITRITESVFQIKRKQIDQTTVFVLTFGAMYAVVNVLGQTKGEVGRIWLFLVPALTIFASSEIINSFPQVKHRTIVYGVLMLLVTSLLIFVFQDYGCRLCP
jgi:hypothetical protein